VLDFLTGAKATMEGQGLEMVQSYRSPYSQRGGVAYDQTIYVPHAGGAYFDYCLLNCHCLADVVSSRCGSAFPADAAPATEMRTT
jgi:hypothetical protein